MKRNRSVLGIILTIVGVFVIIPGLFPSLIVKSPEPGFGPHQQIAVAVGVVLFLIGALLCAKCGKGCCSKEDKPAPPPPAE